MPSCTNVVDRYSGGMTAPVVGSNSWPAWIARVAKSGSDADLSVLMGFLGWVRAWARSSSRRQEGEQIVAGDDGRGLAVDRHEEGIRLGERLARRPDGVVHADEGQRRLHERLEGVGELRLAVEDRVDEAALVDRADHLAHHDGRL